MVGDFQRIPSASWRTPGVRGARRFIGDEALKLLHPLLGREFTGTPVRAGGATGRVGSFGPTRREADGSVKMHKGIDWLAIEGWPVFAAHAGTVIRAGWENPAMHDQGYGLRLYVSSMDVETRYGHLSKIVVDAGKAVTAGGLIGFVGRTGNVGSAPTHLHFEVRIGGEARDPLEHA